MRIEDDHSVNPNYLFKRISSACPRFRGWEQQDAHDLLTNFLDLLDSEQQKRGCQNDLDKTVIQHVFGSKVCSSVLCLKCKRVSRTIDPTDGVMLEVSFNRKERGLSTYFRQVTESHTRVGNKTGKAKP